jgi:MraZ protein
MFLGNYEASFDAKNRVNFPARLRDKIPEPERRSLVLAWHPPDPCLVLYAPSEWGRIEQLVLEASRASPSWDRNVDRHLYGHATEVDLDGVGRILVPEKFKLWADLKKNVVFAGVRNRIEIWDQDRWNAEEQKRIESFRKIGQDLLR